MSGARRRRRSRSGSISLVQDDFNRADGDTLTLGVAPTGQVWEEFGGMRWTIASNQAAPFQSGQFNSGMVINSSNANVTMQFTQKIIGSLTGLVFRLVDANNFWLWYYSSATNIVISKWIAGIETVLFTDTIGASAVNDIWSVSTSVANLITLKRNSNIIRQLTDAQHSGGTKFGFGGASGTSDRYDNFSIVTP